MKILAIDPGKASGFALSEIDDDTGEWRLLSVFVTHDGVDGVSEIFWNSGDNANGIWSYEDADVTIVERFIVRPNQPVDPIALEVIGFIKGTHPRPDSIEWRLRSDKKHIPDAMLKQHGLWYTGKQVGHEDGRDVNDAIIHTLSWLCFKNRHRPTIERFFPDE